MTIPENYTPTPGDKLTKDDKALYVHWIKGGEVGYGVDFGRGDIDALYRLQIDEFSKRVREQGLALVTANVEFRPTHAASSREVAARKSDALQAQLDALMLEFCPEEMTEAQKANWARHQRSASEETQANVATALMGSNDRVEGRDAASSRRVPSHDGLAGND